MAESVFFKPLSIAFAIVTLIESFIWAVLSFLAILCYYDIIGYDSTANYGINVFVFNLHNLYFSSITFTKDRAVTPDIFFALMWIHYLLSLFLCYASGVFIIVLKQKSNIRKINFATIIWQFFTYMVCLFDIIACVLFGVDYHLVKEAIKVDSAETEVMLAVIITCLVLSAKGFVLWIFNFVFSVIITILFRKKVSANNEPILRTGPEVHARNYSAYNAYGDTTTDGPDMQIGNNLNNYSNRTFKHEEETNPDPQSPMNNSSWFANIAFENSRRSYTSGLSDKSFNPSNDPLDGILTANSTWSRIPRASSFRQPRSLVVSLSPSPVPPASMESRRRSAPTDMRDKDMGYEGNSSGYRTEDERREDDEYDEDDDDISESMSKMKRVFPQHRRFNLDEPDPDYEFSKS